MEKDLLINIGYKNLIRSIIKRGYFDKFIKEEEHFLNFKNQPDFFIECLELIKERYTNITSCLISYFAFNQEEKKNISFMKEILKVVDSAEEVDIIFKNCGENNFIKDYELIKQITINTKGSIFRQKISEEIRKDEKLRDYLLDLPNFSLLWFDIVEQLNNEEIIKILKNDFNSYRKLTDEQKNNKEFAICALENLAIKKMENKQYYNIESQFYNYIPLEFRKDKEIALGFANLGFCNQEESVFQNKEVFSSFLNYYLQKHKKNKNHIDLGFLENLPKTIYQNYKNIDTLLNFLNENNNYLYFNYDNFCIINKSIKLMAKSNKFIKEVYKKQDSVWANGNNTEHKNKSSYFFYEYFSTKIPKMHEEFSYYIKMQELTETLAKKEQPNIEKKKSLKI